MEKKVAEETIIASMDDLLGLNEPDYATIPGFLPGKTLRIGSLTAGDLIDWTEAGDGDAKRTAGLRLITKSLCGPAPSNIRYADDVKNIALFRTYKHKATEAMVKEILALNGMTVKGQADTKKD